MSQPKFIELLSETDKKEYNNLRSTLSSNAVRNRRGKRLEAFSEVLTAIKNFCIKGDSDDWKRCLVCGVCWLPEGIAINNRQFQVLIDKCKSSINGSLQKMGYGTIQSRQESIKLLSEHIPFLATNYQEAREWSVRQFISVTPEPSVQTKQYKLIPHAFTPTPQPAVKANDQFYDPYDEYLTNTHHNQEETKFDYSADFNDFQIDTSYNPFNEYDSYSLEQTFTGATNSTA
ncbi:hypothetical protein TVAG_183770 [Trichomonas vaginalis G3]|uniref:Initiator binding domain-containing protein n=1 Tax=Trichomonas vaginalis (strain ATCC PRA-98 / G3) TaxID=412133 RepID=A2D9B4_TRIV3|nr:transcription-initiator DNA-binding domain ibd family [Trichomonas vaginalis G3]EAY23140.1 hypothetical protein TVAG_183770 [Trichomonas vaginalis G3]KAI5513793.1 transcription-initiator DNA-binding domain ibd family [Trichomonas vaginalis G3]|eukprot:XP_001584126.1 hypothetical protein [Trichomonas vaginalis G3]